MTQRPRVCLISGRGLALAFLLALIGSLLAHGQALPPKPARYVTDQAGVLDASTVATLNNQLEKFEKDTSNQILVAVYPSLPPDAEIAQYATDTFNSWQPGQKGKDNGAILFVFIQDRKMFISTGRGLEGALPDAICKRIVTREITPFFRQGNYAAGIQAGVNAMLAATRGEYQGTGSTVAERTFAESRGENQQPPAWFILLFIIVIVISVISRSGGGFGGPIIYTSGGWGGGGYGGGGGFGGGFGGGSGGGGGGGFGGSGDGGGFSGGGGSSAGGGAGGSW